MPAPPILRRLIIAVLERDGPSTLSELSVALERPYDAIEACVRTTRTNQPEVLHIAEWRRSLVIKGKPSPVYKAGKGKDAPRPERLPRIEVSRRYEQRWAHVIKLRKAAKRAKPVPAWLVGLI
ncbi:MAG: hypothetical protein AB9M53_00570 [Leptothrix sp. (in: b-proteobacteria)]